MARIRNRQRRTNDERGQALVEFSLTLPILLLFILGLIDFSIIFFSYTQESNALRNALRYAQLIGYSSDSVPYLNCPELISRASDTYFIDSHDVTIRYRKANDISVTYTCSTISNDLLQNGDILEMEVDAIVKPLFLPLGDLTLHFTGQRSIVKAIPVSYEDPGMDPDAPEAPYPFDVDANCAVADGVPNVSFYWDHLDPATTMLRIFDAEDYSAVREIDVDATHQTSCIDCAEIDPTNGYRCYYARPYTNSLYGPPTNVDCDYCIVTPDPPQNLTLQRNCGKGDVSFDWDWPVDGVGDPIIPTRAEIRDADTNDVLVVYTQDMFITECRYCDTMETPGERSYYMVSISRAGPAEATSVASTIATATCPPDVGVVHGYLREANDSLCSDYGVGFAGKTLVLRNVDSLVAPIDITTDSEGYFLQEDVPAGTYTLEPPPLINDVRPYITQDDGTTCASSGSPTIIVTGGEIFEYTFGYQ